MSGFKIPGLAELGPLEEKTATWGEYDKPKTVPLKVNVAIGDGERSIVMLFQKKKYFELFLSLSDTFKQLNFISVLNYL